MKFSISTLFAVLALLFVSVNTVSAQSADPDEFAAIYKEITAWWASDGEALWNTFLNDYWPLIEPWVFKKWVLPTVGVTIAVSNSAIVFMNLVGGNQIAVIATFAKDYLADFPIGGGLTMHQALDLAVAWFGPQ